MAQSACVVWVEWLLPERSRRKRPSCRGGGGFGGSVASSGANGWVDGWMAAADGRGGARWETSAWGTSGVIQKGTGSPGSPGSRPLATQPGQLQRRGTIPYLPGQGGWGGATGGRIAGAGWLDGQWPMGKVGQQAGVRGVSVCPRVCECVTVQVCVCACVRACVRVLVFVHVLLLL